MTARGEKKPAAEQPYRSWLVAWRNEPTEDWTWALMPMTQDEAHECGGKMTKKYSHVMSFDTDTVYATLAQRVDAA